ncbi:methylaspartate mutase subunit E (MutE) superfamily protein [Streptomyces himastatinicus ATCC 53653]|uniref:Methylaspartate mutase subunit E (MutE) superfamily protein n=1 Tax=Streptomyces himastatinicus ATCC 53653 TaxID=457427 RepID=D9WEG1_9ACTN|nr:methylaspartate mutase [Streptomyces himastatinicus]EFL23200.1 methylaspartate mutase subunit E (MutE) superfamily protein [Streptomyces himastatinicus ATCC 53653]
MSEGFGAFVRAHGGEGRLVVQPRMGFGDPHRMREGLAATRAADALTVGTITLDAHTRVGHLQAVERALRDGSDLNGYPIVSHEESVTRWVLSAASGPGFPVQVRHGSAAPADIFRTLTRLGLGASEGGPVSYCLPYGRTPLAESVRNWRESCEVFAGLRERGVEPHLETFGGCMLGQLCPPSQLIAISVLEALFFIRHGVRSVSVSYAQQTHPGQDREAVAALRRLCGELLPTDDWHVVVYAYMGLYPVTEHGAYRLLGQAAELAVASGAERLIVKTVAESRRIPTIEENVAALEYADRTAALTGRAPDPGADTQTYREAAALTEAVLNLHPDIGEALLRAFRAGYLDIPYCLHPDNRGETRGRIGDDGRLLWERTGALPIGRIAGSHRARPVTSAGLLEDLSYMRRRFDEVAVEHRTPLPVPGTRGTGAG